MKTKVEVTLFASTYGSIIACDRESLLELHEAYALYAALGLSTAFPDAEVVITPVSVGFSGETRVVVSAGSKVITEETVRQVLSAIWGMWCKRGWAAWIETFARDRRHANELEMLRRSLGHQ